MSDHAAELDYSPAALAAALSGASLLNCREPILNDLLADVRQLAHQPAPALAVELAVGAARQIAALELTYAADWLNINAETACDFLRFFRQPQPPERLAYLCLNRKLEEWPELPNTIVTQRTHTFAGIAFLQRVTRWAERYSHYAPYDLRDLRRINLQFPFAAAVFDAPATTVDELIMTLCFDLGIETIILDESVADHHLASWLTERLKLSGGQNQAKQTRLGFTEAGGTANSLFVVRAMGGTDGFEVRGTVGEDLALIIDIGDREVTKAATAYLEKHVVHVINEQTEFTAAQVGQSLRLRWYDTRLSAEDLAKTLHQALKKQFILKTISVNLIFDPLRINSLKPSILGYIEERSTELVRRREESSPMVICHDCQHYAPHCFEVASVDCPPGSGRSYDEVSTLAQFTRGMDYFLIDSGVCQDRTKGSYLGIDKFVRLFSEGHVSYVNLHSLRETPLPCMPNPQCIAWYLKELDVICIVSQDYDGRTPDGKSFDLLLEKIAGQQVPGFAGIAEEYIQNPRFFTTEGGLSRVAWMNEALKRRLNIRLEHILTEEECINMAGMKAAMAAWRH